VQASDLRPLRVGETLDVAIKIYTRNAAELFKVVAVVAIPVQLLSAAILASVAPEESALLRPTLPSEGQAPPAPGDLDVFLVGIALLALVGVLGSLLATAASFKAVGDAYLGVRPRWSESLRYALRRLHSLLWVALLPGILIALALAAAIVPGIVADSLALIVIGALVGLGFSVWAYVSWAVSIPALLMEGARGRRALGRSLTLVRGRWWATFGALVLGYLIYAILGAIISGLFTALLFTDVGDNVVVGVAVDAIGGAVGSILTTPLLAALVTVVYFDLRVRKEGFDLELLARDIGVEPAARPRGELAPASGRLPSAEEEGAQPPFWPPPPGWRPPPREREG
jgi:hypothetical protein